MPAPPRSANCDPWWRRRFRRRFRLRGPVFETSATGSSAGLREERLDIAGRDSDAEQPAPHREARQCVVDLRLREQTLRFGDLVDVAESGLVAGRGLLCGGAR